jgi:tetratricopeptide (TPR) repeat protein
MRILLAILLTLCTATGAAADDMASALAELGHDWAKVYYQTPEDGQASLFPALTARIDALVAQHPEAAEPLIWKAIVFSSYAKAKGGLGALDLAEAARDAALQAAKIDDHALEAGAYTALGALYYKVPGWPIGFGNDSKAQVYLDRALAIAPNAVDVNYFYGDFMLEQGDKKKARAFLEKALAAPPRPGREDEDAGRRKEVEADLARVGA